MSELIKEIENDIAALNAKLDRVKLLEDKFELCAKGYAVYNAGGIGLNSCTENKIFAVIYKTEEQAIKRRRMLYLQNVEFQLAEHFNRGEECDWSDGDAAKYSISNSHCGKKWIVTRNHFEQRLGVSYFVSEEAAEKAFPHYIEAVERYDRGEV